MLSGCEGIFTGIYDDADSNSTSPGTNIINVDASDWQKWHFINLKTGKICSYDIPVASGETFTDEPRLGTPGIYTYWYDVFGEGISKYEFRYFTPSISQPEPEDWSIAVHRNNVRTNNGGVAETSYNSIDDLPEDSQWLYDLEYIADVWNQTDVWAVKDKMLNGIIGNQGITINRVLSGWLKMQIPPVPPAFSLNSHVFILKLEDDSFAALQLKDYMNIAGTKCVLSIAYKYPL